LKLLVRRMKILIVDDSRTMRMIVKRTLKRAGFQGHDIIEAENGQQGLDLVKLQHPELIICDWNMPVMDGMQFLQTIISEGLTAHFGFVTSEGTAKMEKTALENGAKFFIHKPFTIDTFKEKLSQFLL